jgi:hypothetical protein
MSRIPPVKGSNIREGRVRHQFFEPLRYQAATASLVAMREARAAHGKRGIRGIIAGLMGPGRRGPAHPFGPKETSYTTTNPNLHGSPMRAQSPCRCFGA